MGSPMARPTSAGIKDRPMSAGRPAGTSMGKYGRTWRRKTQRPALTRLPGGFSGFSQNPVTRPESSISTTPHADGFGERNRAMEAIRSWVAWNAISADSGKVKTGRNLHGQIRPHLAAKNVETSFDQIAGRILRLLPEPRNKAGEVHLHHPTRGRIWGAEQGHRGDPIVSSMERDQLGQREGGEVVGVYD